jgi:acylphosphatase
MRTISILVSGKVQGVFYRQSTREKAREIGVTGEVRNLPNGNVQIIATGSEQALDALVSWCKLGPERAIVDQVQTSDLELKNFSDFKIIR